MKNLKSNWNFCRRVSEVLQSILDQKPCLYAIGEQNPFKVMLVSFNFKVRNELELWISNSKFVLQLLKDAGHLALILRVSPNAPSPRRQQWCNYKFFNEVRSAGQTLLYLDRNLIM